MRFTYQSGAQPLAGFTIQRGIHRGGFGEVYFAQSTGGKEVALKLLHQQDHEVEVRGVTQCLNLKHPNLVNLFDLKTDDQGDHWVVMEYVGGSSLEDVLESFPDGLPLVEVRDWLVGLVAGVSHLHERGIVHRDLKPANVYRENGIVKVGDVGLSKRIDNGTGRQNTQSVGTVYYMAPEVAKGQYGPEVDVYSLGVMLYELITGKLPFCGETTAEILMKHLTAQPDLLPIPRPLRPTIARALEKDPRKRTPTARQLEQDFLHAMNSSGSQTIPDSAFLPPVPPAPNGTATKYANMNGTTNNGPSPWISIRVNRPLPNSPSSASEASRPIPVGRTTDRRPFPKIAIFAIVAMILFAPKIGSSQPWIGMSLIGAAFGLALFRRSNTNRLDSQQAPPQAATFRTGPVPVQPTATRRTLAEESTPQESRSLSERLAEVSQSIGSASLFASLLSAGIFLSLGTFQRSVFVNEVVNGTWPESFFSLDSIHRFAMMPSFEHAALFIAVSIVGSWLLLIGHACTRDASWTRRQRWGVRLIVGALIGTCAFALDQALFVNIPKAAYAARPIFSSLGLRSLTVASVDPTWLGYVWFFAGWVGMRRWSRELNPFRKQRFSIFLTASAVVVAYVMSYMFAFPQWYAMLWAGTISTTLQLASPWTPRPSPVRRR